MKLKSLAALLFRLLGASFILSGLSDSLSEIMDTHKTAPLALAMIGLVLGSLMIKYSKKLADLFCQGLDDDRT